MGKTILIADDELSVRRFLTRTLAGAGYEVLQAGGAAEAREAIRIHGGSMALLIADIRMPGGNGLDLAVHLEATRPGTPVLFISGLIDSIAVESLLLRDPLAILRKPFTAEEFLGRVRTLLDAAQFQPATEPWTEGAPNPAKKTPVREIAPPARRRQAS
jgi:DNA-binding NtrC family response regulator